MCHLRTRVVFCMTFAVFACSVQALAGTGIVIEAVNDYSFVSKDNTLAIQEVTPFWNTMTSTAPWHAINFFQNNDVYDTDFFDPDLTGYPGDQGDSYFDLSNAGISMAIGHGLCQQNCPYVKACSSDADCASLGFLHAYCAGGQLGAGEHHICIGGAERHFLTSSTHSQHLNDIKYGPHSLDNAFWKSFAMGESYDSGGWAGVGTNGGTNLFILKNSCGLRWRQWNLDTQYMFAGMHLLFILAPVSAFTDSQGLRGNSDAKTCPDSGCGATLASYIVANMAAPAYEAWTNPTLVNVNFGCAGDAGVNCVNHNEGINVVIAKDASYQQAYNRAMQESWYGLESNMDATGGAYSWGIGACNYDCFTYGT